MISMYEYRVYRVSLLKEILAGGGKKPENKENHI